MTSPTRSIEEYEANGGWSSHHFAEGAVKLLKELQELGHNVIVGRHVIWVGSGEKLLKAYPHYKGRSREYATITCRKGVELATFHHTEFDKLREFILSKI